LADFDRFFGPLESNVESAKIWGWTGVVWFRMAVSRQVVRGITLCSLFYLGSNRFNYHADLVSPFACFPSLATGGELRGRAPADQAPSQQAELVS